MTSKVTKSLSKKNQKLKSIRISLETYKTLKSMCEYNAKAGFKRKLKPEVIIALGLLKIADSDLNLLLEKEMTNEERKERFRQIYIQQIGEISKDDFTGFTMTEAFQEFVKQCSIASSNNAMAV